MSGQHRYRPGHTVPAELVIWRCERHDPAPLPSFSGELPLDDNPEDSRPCYPLTPPDGTPVAAGVGEPRLPASAATAKSTTRYTVRWPV